MGEWREEDRVPQIHRYSKWPNTYKKREKNEAEKYLRDIATNSAKLLKDSNPQEQQQRSSNTEKDTNL